MKLGDHEIDDDEEVIKLRLEIDKYKNYVKIFTTKSNMNR